MTPHQKRIAEKLTGRSMKLYMLKNLPMGLIAGLRIDSADENQCTTSVPFKWLTKNPFRSMYFAVQAMAAELSTATHCLIATTGTKPSVAFIIVKCEAQFVKKAISRVKFTCLDIQQAYEAVEQCQSSSEAIEKTFTTVGKQKDGSVVAEFKFTWSFKRRSS